MESSEIEVTLIKTVQRVYKRVVRVMIDIPDDEDEDDLAADEARSIYEDEDCLPDNHVGWVPGDPEVVDTEYDWNWS